MTATVPHMPCIVGHLDSRTGQPATVWTPREWLVADDDAGEALYETPGDVTYPAPKWVDLFGIDPDYPESEADELTRLRAIVTAVEALIGARSFGAFIPHLRTAHHNGAHDVLLVADLRAALAPKDEGHWPPRTQESGGGRDE